MFGEYYERSARYVGFSRDSRYFHNYDIDYTFRDEVFPIFNHIAFFYTFEGGIVP